MDTGREGQCRTLPLHLCGEVYEFTYPKHQYKKMTQGLKDTGMLNRACIYKLEPVGGTHDLTKEGIQDAPLKFSTKFYASEFTYIFLWRGSLGNTVLLVQRNQ